MVLVHEAQLLDSFHLLKITACHARKHQDWDHQQYKGTSHCSYRRAQLSEIPRPRSEAIPNEKDADGNGYGEGNEGGDRADREQGASSQRSTKDQKVHHDTDACVEPDCVHWGPCVPIDSFRDVGQRSEASVAGIGECDP